MNQLRSLIRQILESKEEAEEKRKEKKKTKNLLVEPDKVKEREKEDKDEVSAGGVPGVAVPLGAGPHYPAPDSPAVKRVKKQIDVVGRAFGGATPTNKRKK